MRLRLNYPAVVKRIALQPPAFSRRLAGVCALLSDRTRLVILNTPHNPSATVGITPILTRCGRRLKNARSLSSATKFMSISVSPNRHASVLAHSELRERAVAVSSFGKTYHMTGWKVGYCVAPAAISAELRKVHQYLTFSVNTPAQLALADMLREDPAHYRGTARVLSEKTRRVSERAATADWKFCRVKAHTFTGRLQRRFLA